MRFVLALLTAAALLSLTGCASTESENASSRPWNTPTKWESGLPGGMSEGR